MGLALLIFVLKTMALRGDRVANQAVRFWAKIFGVTFVMGVVTGIPMEFQFGTNWSRFSETAGGIIGQTLAMEGVFACEYRALPLIYEPRLVCFFSCWAFHLKFSFDLNESARSRGLSCRTGSDRRW